MIAEGKKIDECYDYIAKRGITPLTDKFFYRESNGKLIAVAGLLICMGKESLFAQIEPMKSESKKASYELYNEIIEYLKKYKVQYVLAGSSNPKLLNALEGLGWRKYTENITQYIRKI